MSIMLCIFQEPENSVLYSLVKDDDSEWFNIDAKSGMITIKQQVSYDGNRPPRYQVTSCIMSYQRGEGANLGKGVFISRKQGDNGHILKGTKKILWKRKHKKHFVLLFGNCGTSKFIKPLLHKLVLDHDIIFYF